MKELVLIAVAMPYEQAERYALGEHHDVPMFYVVGGIITLIGMGWFMYKAKKDKRQALKEKRRGKRDESLTNFLNSGPVNSVDMFLERAFIKPAFLPTFGVE